VRLDIPPGRDPEDAIDYRLDAGPPEKPRRVMAVTLRLDTVARIIKKLLRIKR